MHVFAALVPSVEAVRALEDAVALAGSLLPRVEWTSSDDWHLALAYFGNISQRELDRLDVAMRELTGRWPAMGVRVQGIGAHPEPHEATGLWARIQELDDSLQRLSTAVLSAVKGFGWVLDRRVFRPHLVLGRSSEPVDARPFLDRLATYTGPGWAFDTLVILWARPLDDGAVVPEIVETHPMSGRG